MKIEVLQENLSTALSKVVRAVSTRPQLPVLSNILIDGRKDGLYLSSTDLEMAIKVKVGAKVDEVGKVTVPAKLFSEFVSNVPAGTIEIVLDKEVMKLKSGSYKAKFQTISADEFPEIVDPKSVEGEGSVEVDRGVFDESLGRVMFAAAKDSMRPVLTGVYFEFKSSSLNLVATDGFRLAVEKLKVGKTESSSFIVPSRALSEVLKVEGDKIKFRFLKESNQVVFLSGDDMVLSQVIEGSYPDYSKIIPDDYETEVEFDREEMLQATKASLIFARENSNVIRWQVEGGKIKVVSESPEQGDNTVEVECKMDGAGGEVAYNGRFVQDLLVSMGGDKVIYGMGGALEPGLFKDSESESFLYVVMPINL